MNPSHEPRATSHQPRAMSHEPYPPRATSHQPRAMSHNGFTLLEVLVALSVMAVAVTLIIELFSANLRALTVSGNAVAAASKADSRLREILMDSSLAVTSWREEKETGYPMDISITDISQERTDNLPVKLLEVALTIHWKEGLKEKKFTLRTLKMIDKEESG